MRLTRLEIENFKGIGERQVIEISPITLLFGPNSAGKSSILQAVRYFHQVLEGKLSGRNDGADPQNESGMENFASLVHCHDLTKTIKIKASASLNENFYSENFSINHGVIVESEPDKILPKTLSSLLGDSKFSELAVSYLNGSEEHCKVTDVAVSIEVAWEENPGLFVSTDYLKSLEIDINNQNMMKICLQNPSARAAGLPISCEAKVEINRQHYLLKSFSDINKTDYDLANKTESNVYELREKEKNWNTDEVNENESEQEEVGEGKAGSEENAHLSPLEKELLDLVYGSVENANLSEIGDSIVLDATKFDLTQIEDYSIHQQNQDKGDIVLPVDIISQEKDFDRTKKYASGDGGRWLRIELLLSELISGSMQSVSGATEVSRESAFSPSSRIGPLRPIPFRGKSGTVLDRTDDTEFVRKVNHWLEQRFNLDYAIKRFKLKVLPEDQLIDFDNGEPKSRIAGKHTEDPAAFFPQMPEDCHMAVKLHDKRRQIDLDFIDVGVGMPQLVAVLAAALYEHNYGIVMLEQPELHLHPAIQVELGDLFIESTCEHSGMERVFLIETHSEHLLLRLLRRIEETTENELPSNIVGLHAEDVSIIYVEPLRTKKSTKTRIKRLRVDNTGEFVDRWPNGFFDERAGELF